MDKKETIKHESRTEWHKTTRMPDGTEITEPMSNDVSHTVKMPPKEE